jgi:hypothetical protein
MNKIALTTTYYRSGKRRRARDEAYFGFSTLLEIEEVDSFSMKSPSK